MPRASSSSIEKAMQYVEEGRLSTVRLFLKEAAGIVQQRTKAEAAGKRAPQSTAGKSAAHAPATRKPRASRSKASKAARSAGNGGTSAPAGTDRVPAGNAAAPGAGSLSMQEQERTFLEAEQ